MKIINSVIIALSILISANLLAQGQSRHQDQIEDLMSNYSSLNIQPTQTDEALADHEKLFHFSRNYGSFLIKQIQNKQELTGPQLNLIHISLGSFLTLTEIIDQHISFKMQRNQRDLAQLVHARIKISERYKTIHSLFLNNAILRRIIDDKSGFEKYGLSSLDQLSQTILSAQRARDIKKYLNQISNSELEKEEGLNQTTTYLLYKENHSLKEIYATDTFWTDTLKSLSTEVSRGLSWAFGTSIGNIEWDDGALKENPEFLAETYRLLKPLDLIYEKRRSKLTDYTIPGHWGHVGVWLGTQEQLESLGIWDHPALDLFRDQISAGNSIYEVRRWGLDFDNLESFSNLDEMAITRKKNLIAGPQNKIIEIFETLAAQDGKEYDFTFNVLATDKTTCTEIIYLSYGHINWPTEHILGRKTISPNNVAELTFYENSPMEFVSYTTSDKNGQMIKRSERDFAKTVDFRAKYDSQRTLSYEKVLRKCQRQRFRRNGAIKFRTVCHHEFEVKPYEEVRRFLRELGLHLKKQSY